MKSSSKLIHTLLISFLLLVIYLITHLIGLTKLPVFADEAIYIRWAQLILDDSRQYFFFPLNDGKTPLFIWQLVPILPLFQNPVYAARLVSVAGGLLQVIAMVLLIKQLKGGKVSQIVGAVLTIFLPFWFFHHRMALMDGWLTVWLTFTTVFLLKSLQSKRILWAFVSGIFLGASLLTKIPAILAIPSLVLISLTAYKSPRTLGLITKHLIVMTIVGVGVLACLKISPAFSQLFSRGGDFLFSVTDVFNGIWFTTIQNTPSYLTDFWQYATPPIVLVFIGSVFIKEDRKRSVFLFLSFLAFCVPIALMGKVVFPRYLFPAMIFLTASASLTVESLMQYKNSVLKWSGVAAVIIALLFSSLYIYPSITNPDKTPFVTADQGQYLTEWSSGHGIEEISIKVLKDSQDQTIAVATEGYFGTLPDGLLLYLYNKDISNISVEGVGQPISNIPGALINKKDQYDRLWLVVNSHRKNFELPPSALLASYCRPFNAPCLELWDVTDQVRKTDE